MDDIVITIFERQEVKIQSIAIITSVYIWSAYTSLIYICAIWNYKTLLCKPNKDLKNMYFLAELVISRPSLHTPGLTLWFETFFWIIIYYTTCTTKSLPLRQELSLCSSPNASLDAFVKVVGKIWENNKASGKKKSPLPLFQFFGLAFLMKRPAVFAMPCGVLIQTLPSHVWLKPENGHTHPCPSISQKDTAKVTRRRWKLEGRQLWMELLGVQLVIDTCPRTKGILAGLLTQNA